MKNKIMSRIIRIVLIIVAVICFLIIALFSIPILFYLSYPDPPKPEIKYGEFPFELVYELDGETFIIEDTLIIEYKGVGANEGVGKYNEWNRYLKSQQVENYIRHNVILFDGLLQNGNSALIYLELGSCEYYMGLEEDRIYYYYSDTKPGDIAILTHEYNGSISTEELYNNYNINLKIIKLELSSPIK